LTLNHTRPCADLHNSIERLVKLHDLLSCLSGKWVPVILASLATGSKRNFQLRHAAPGISAKSLSQVLRRLISDGFVAQSLHTDEGGQVGVGYHLTELGSSVVELIGDIDAWVSTHYDALERSRGDGSHLREKEQTSGIPGSPSAHSLLLADQVGDPLPWTT
jgi:DNA-binding HxlR family transcriptional regulator